MALKLSAGLMLIEHVALSSNIKRWFLSPDPAERLEIIALSKPWPWFFPKAGDPV